MYCCCCVAIGGGGCCCRGGAGGIPGPGPCQGPPNFMLLLLLYLRKKADTELLLFVFVLRARFSRVVGEDDDVFCSFCTVDRPTNTRQSFTYIPTLSCTSK